MKKIFIIAFAVLGLCACNKVESLKEPAEAPVIYHMVLHSSLDVRTKGVTFDNDGVTIDTHFSETDNVYVYNISQDAFARDGNEYKLMAMHPSEISSDGHSCSLKGDLTFYKKGSEGWESVTVEATDTYVLYYGMNVPDFTQGGNSIPRFDYTEQEGSRDSASDFDFAQSADEITMNLDDNTLSAPGDIRFENLQSMFRQRLTFKKGDETVSPTITKLTVGTLNETLLCYYQPTFEDTFNRYQTYDSFDIYNPVISSDGDIYLSLSFYYDGSSAEDDQLILTAVDNEGNVYERACDVPDGGFTPGNYYYGAMTLAWKYQYVKPLVTRSDGGDEDELEPNDYGWYQYDINGPSGNDVKIAISGNSSYYRFYLYDPACVTLTGSGNPVTASWSEQSAFIESDDDLTIILDCDYFIDNSAEYEMAIECGGELKLKTTGGTQTLTVVTNDDGSFAYGIYGDSNFDAWNYDLDDIDNLAADGFTVSCPGAVNNGDGSYTWVYTVAPNIGTVMGANGVVYADVAAAEAAGTTAEAMIAYVGRIDGVCAHGLAISLTNIENYRMNYAAATGEYAIPVWASAHPVTGGAWHLPTEADWQYMLWGYYATNPVAQDITAFNALLGAVGTALPNNEYFWSATETDTDNAFAVYYDNAGVNAGFDEILKTEAAYVRACLRY